jgi:hypothetical protein
VIRPDRDDDALDDPLGDELAPEDAELVVDEPPQPVRRVEVAATEAMVMRKRRRTATPGARG